MNIQERMRRDSGVLKLLGIELVDHGPGEVVLAMTVRSDQINAAGMCHGGIVFALSDTASAYALGNVDGFRPATVDANITYVRPGRLGDRLTATARVIRAGRSSGQCAVDVHNAAGDLLALFRSTCANVAGKE